VSGRPTAGIDRPEKNPRRDEQAAPPWRSLALVMGPSLVVIIYAIVGTLTTILSALAPRGSGSRRLLRIPLVGGALLPWAYLLIVRPWHSRWGATEEEARRALPHDHFVPDPIYQTTRAMTINTHAGQVWQWLVQVGQDRGGLYSYDWLENLADLDVQSAKEIVPELQDLKVGDLVRLAPESMGAEAGLRVAAMEPGRALVLHQPAEAKFAERRLEELPRTPCLRTSENAPSKTLGE
jgi:hypothetical protein